MRRASVRPNLPLPLLALLEGVVGSVPLLSPATVVLFLTSAMVD